MRSRYLACHVALRPQKRSCWGFGGLSHPSVELVLHSRRFSAYGFSAYGKPACGNRSAIFDLRCFEDVDVGAVPLPAGVPATHPADIAGLLELAEALSVDPPPADPGPDFTRVRRAGSQLSGLLSRKARRNSCGL